ncbi:ribosome maturation factor RimM [Oceanobacillus sp. FSL H7-0719]|uniref:ribosome maturation factor RimM n=1 Tax=Oceanobacillus sp. FSL H7-0719 TaxID=2954507 RepID=UPI0032473B31
MTDKMFNIGKIVNTHGIRGEVKVKRISDFEERFTSGEKVYLETETELIPLTIAAHRVHKGFDLIQFEEFNNINDVEKYKGMMLQIKETQLTELTEHEFYYYEIIGCEVFTLDGEIVGKVKEILAPGANDVWVVQRKGKKDALIPYIGQVVKEIDVQNKKVRIEPMEGLLD